MRYGRSLVFAQGVVAIGKFEQRSDAIFDFALAAALDELVDAAVYLASAASSFVNGETIRIDGGYLASGI